METVPHQEAVKAKLRVVVKRVLRRRGVRAEDLEPMALQIMQQAETTFAGRPLQAACQIGTLARLRQRE